MPEMRAILRPLMPAPHVRFTLSVLLGLTCAAVGASAAPVAPAGLGAAPVAPPPEQGARHTYSLSECLARAELNHPNVWAARARLDQMRAQLSEARSAPFSQFTFTAGAGPAPTLRGNNLYSPNTEVSLSSNMGIGWRVALEGLVPLWTFGKISSLWDAAEAQLKVGEADVNRQKNLVAMDVRRAYYGLELARDGIVLLKEVIDALDKALEHLHDEVTEGNGDEVDEFKLRTLRYELEARHAEAQRYQTMALAGLRFLTGVSTDFDIPDAPLRPVERRLLPVSEYLTAAHLYRPEINMARAGILARRAQVELARAKYFPDIGIAISAAWQRAPEVADQLNPFIRDDANYLRYGAALALRWQLDFLPNAARVAQAEAQLEEIRQTERFALGGVGVEVETAYAQVVDALARERAYGSAQATARKWLIAVQQGIDVGTREDADLVDPARQWAQQRYNHLNAVMDLNLAWASLVLATGWGGVLPSGG